MYQLERHVLYPETHIDVRYFHIASCEVNPVYFCFIFSVIFIFLKFFRPVQYNVAGWNNRFVICIIKMKMPTTSSDIYNLIIQTSPWTIGRKFGMSGKTVSATGYSVWSLCTYF